MKQEKRRHSPEFKAKIALEAIKGKFTVVELSEKYDVHPSLIRSWKRMVLDSAPRIMEKGAKALDPGTESRKERDRQIDRLRQENEWLQGILQRLSVSERRAAIEEGETKLPLMRQVKLLNINRSAVYYHRRFHSARMEEEKDATPDFGDAAMVQDVLFASAGMKT